MKRKLCRGIFILSLFLLPCIGHSQEENTLNDCFYKLTDKKGKEIGYVHYILKESMWQNISCCEVIKEDECSGGWLFIKNRMEGKEKAYVGKERGILYFERMETHNISSPKVKMKVNYNGIREKDVMIMTEKPGEIIVEDKGKEYKKAVEEKGKRKEVDLSKIDCLSYELDLPVMRQIIRLSVGEKRNLRIFDPEFSIIREGEIAVKEKVKINIAEKEYEAYHLKGKFDKEKIDIWLSEDGKLMLKKKDSEGEMILQPKGCK